MPQCWRTPTAVDAYVLSIVSLALTLVAAIGGIVAYKILDDSLLFVYGLENCVDFVSSAIVVWRFNKPEKGDHEMRKALLEAREKRAEIGISMILGILGFGSIIVSSEDFSKGYEEEDETQLWILYYLAFGSLLIFGALSMLKFRYADALNSPSLYKDGICSLIGTCLALSLFFNTVLSLSTSVQLWWLDPCVALICGVSSLVYALYSIYVAFVREGLPIFNPHWWLYSAKKSNTTLSDANQQDHVDESVPNDDHHLHLQKSNGETINDETQITDEVEMTQTTNAKSSIPPATPPASSFAHSQDTIPTPVEVSDPETGMKSPSEKIDISNVDLI